MVSVQEPARRDSADIAADHTRPALAPADKTQPEPADNRGPASAARTPAVDSSAAVDNRAVENWVGAERASRKADHSRAAVADRRVDRRLPEGIPVGEPGRDASVRREIALAAEGRHPVAWDTRVRPADLAACPAETDQTLPYNPSLMRTDSLPGANRYLAISRAERQLIPRHVFAGAQVPLIQLLSLAVVAASAKQEVDGG